MVVKCPECRQPMSKGAKDWKCPNGHSKSRFGEKSRGLSLLLKAHINDEKTRKWLEDLERSNDRAEVRWHWYQREDGLIVEKMGEKIIGILSVPEFCEKLARETLGRT